MSLEPEPATPKTEAAEILSRFHDPPPFTALGPAFAPASDPAKLSRLQSLVGADLGSWIDHLRRAGVVADRRNSPNLFEQFYQTLRRPIDTVICGALDADPAACLSTAIAAQFPLEIAAAMLVLDRTTRARRSAIVVDAAAPWSWFRSLRRACSDLKIRVEPIANDYPQADPTLLLYELLGRRLRPGRLPTEQGVLVIDPATALAIGRYALLQEPMLQSPLVVRDHVMDRSHFLVTPIGTTLGEILEKINVPRSACVLRGGDLLRDVRLSSDFVIGGGELVIHIAGLQAAVNPDPCIRCGWCVQACPTRVQPADVLDAVQLDDMDQAEHAGIEACIECGICSYVCPSFLPLLAGIRKMKRTIKETQ
jgi:electron transport complex protein RnfC